MTATPIAVTYEPWRGNYGPTGEAVTLAHTDTLENADLVVRAHHGRPLQRPVSSYPSVGKAAESATHALHIIGCGTYRYVEVSR